MCLLFQYPYAIYYCIYLCVNKVENPGPAYWNSLPERCKTRKRVEIPRPSLLRISTQTTQIGKIGRDSRGCLLEFSTQMEGNSEKGRDSKFRRPLSCFHAPINRYPNYNMFLFPLLSSRIIYCYS